MTASKRTVKGKTGAKPKGDLGRPAKRTSKGRVTSKILTNLGADEAKVALLVLASRHQELAAEIEQIVADSASTMRFKDVADQVVAAIGQLTMFDIGTHSGSDPLGYQQPHESAADLMSEAIRPFVETVRRHAAMGLAESALAACEGVLLGLYRAERERASELIEWIPDGLAELADDPLSALSPVRQKHLTSARQRVSPELRAFARTHLREWTWLHK